MSFKEEIEVGGRSLSIEVGKVAKQADGAAWVRYGDTIILATAVSAREPIEGADFLPLTVDYREKMYASGKIPGGYFKREGRPSEVEILSSRLIDRPIRPLLPKDYHHDTQVLVNVFSADTENLPDVVGAVAASAALHLSDIPFAGPIAAVRVGMTDGQYLLNPSSAQLESSRLELIVAGTAASITMVEGVSKEVSEEEMIGAIEFAHIHIRAIVGLQNRLREKMDLAKREYHQTEIPANLAEAVHSRCSGALESICRITDKTARRDQRKALENQIQQELAEGFPDSEQIIEGLFDDRYKEVVRHMILADAKRLDGRGCDEIRPISIELGILPRAHGSALFTRGQTQALACTTLGTKEDEQRVDGLGTEYFRRYMFHYNFPPFCTGESKRFMGPSRRDIGHGNLAERALQAVLPAWETFPYTIRVTSDVLESNGSSSMASVCAGLLSLMDAGVPVAKHVAGIAMGLVKEGDRTAILTDILGDEDHLGDMDFKVAGTRDGITAFQMDIKIQGLSTATMRQALEKAQDARYRILTLMEEAIPAAKTEMSPYAPRIISIRVPVDMIGMIIGPGGKMIREIVEKSGAKIDIMDDGQVNIASVDGLSSEKAKTMIEALLEEPEIGKIYTGTVKKIVEFGAFLEILPGKEGLLHISEIDRHRINSVTDVLKVGDEVEVKLLSIDPRGKLDLSRRALLIAQDNPDAPQQPYVRQRPPRPEGRDSRGGRDRDRGGFRGPR